MHLCLFSPFSCFSFLLPSATASALNPLTLPQPLNLKDSSGQSLPPVTAIAAGTRHAILRTQDMRLWSFGDNLAGQCGVPGHQTRLSTPKARILHSPLKRQKERRNEETSLQRVVDVYRLALVKTLSLYTGLWRKKAREREKAFCLLNDLSSGSWRRIRTDRYLDALPKCRRGKSIWIPESMA